MTRHKARVQLVCRNCGLVYWKTPSQSGRPFHNAECYREYINSPDRFWERVRSDDAPDACWVHTAPADRDGYIHVAFRGKIKTAHQHAWKLAAGEDVPQKHLIGHTCDNPPCVRNDGPETVYYVNGKSLRCFGHLFLGTDADNNADKEAKARGNHPRGESHGRAKLTLSDVSSIRARYAAGLATQVQLATKFQMTQSAISKIVRLANWTH